MREESHIYLLECLKFENVGYVALWDEGNNGDYSNWDKKGVWGHSPTARFPHPWLCLFSKRAYCDFTVAMEVCPYNMVGSTILLMPKFIV